MPDEPYGDGEPERTTPVSPGISEPPPWPPQPPGAPYDAPPPVGSAPPPTEPDSRQDPTSQGYPPPYGTPTAQPPYGAPVYDTPTAQPPYGAPPPPPPYVPGHPYALYPPAYAWPYVATPAPRPPRTKEDRKRRARKGLALLGVIVLAMGAGIWIGAAVAPQNPRTAARALVSRSMQETVKAGSFRYVETSTALGNPDDISGDAGPSSGRQVIKVNCKTGTNIFDLRLVRGVVYFRGNAPAVADQLGVAQAKAASEADLWVRVVRGEKPYQSFAVGITARSNISQIRTMFVPSFSRPAARTTPPSTAIFGQLAYGKGRPPVGEARYVVGTSSALPRSFDAVTTTTVGRSTQTWTFERFGEHLDVAVPSGAVPYASLHASTPSKGSCA